MDTKRWLMLFGAALAASALVVFAAACGDDEGDGGAATPTDTAATEPAATEPDATEPSASTELDISAQDTTFDTDALTAPADEAFSVTLDNQDDGIPHTFSIYETEAAADAGDDAIAATDQITGPDTVTLDVDPLAAGEYYFQCDVHLGLMSGTLTVE